MKARIAKIFPSGSVRARLAGGAFWSLVSALFAQGSTALATVVIANVLGRDGYGRFAMVQSTVGLFASFAGLALGFTANRYVAQYRSVDPSKAGRILGLSSLIGIFSGLLAGCAVLAFAGWIARHTLGAPDMARFIRLAAPLLFLSAYAGVQSGALAGFEAFKEQSLLAGVTGVVNAICLSIGAWLGGISGAVIALIVSAILAQVATHVVLWQKCRSHRISVQYRHVWQERHALFSFALPSFLAGMMYMPVVWAANAMLVNRPNGFADLGAFNIGNQWRNLLLFLPSRVDAPFLSVASEMYGTKQFGRLRSILSKIILINVAVTSVAAIPLSILAPYVLRIYGAGFATHTLTFQLLVLLAVLLAANVALAPLIAGIGAMWIGFFLNLVWAGVLLPATWFLVRRHGDTGLAAAFVLSYITHTALTIIVVIRHLKSAEKRASIDGVRELVPVPFVPTDDPANSLLAPSALS